MKPSLQLRLSQHLALTPQLQQSIRLLQFSTVELNQEIERLLMENPILERDDGENEFAAAETSGAEAAPAVPGSAPGTVDSGERSSFDREADAQAELPPDYAAPWRGADEGSGDEEGDRAQAAAGSPTLRARFEISDPGGRVLASFEEDAMSFDGTGYAAHWNPVDTDELVNDFAIETAEAIVRWSRGDELDLSIW